MVSYTHGNKVLCHFNEGRTVDSIARAGGKVMKCPKCGSEISQSDEQKVLVTLIEGLLENTEKIRQFIGKDTYDAMWEQINRGGTRNQWLRGQR
jgi:hypothetical protein